MTELAVVIGGAGAMLILVGLIGGGFTFSGSVMPTVGRTARVSCFSVGGLMTVVAIGLAASTVEVAQGPERGEPVRDAQPASTTPTTTPSTTPATTPAAPSPAPTGSGFVLSDTGETEAVVRDRPSSAGGAVGVLSDGDLVSITCTAQGEVVTRSDGTTSGLWDFVGSGYLPDVYVVTGTDQATAPTCR